MVSCLKGITGVNASWSSQIKKFKVMPGLRSAWLLVLRVEIAWNPQVALLHWRNETPDKNNKSGIGVPVRYSKTKQIKQHSAG